MLPVRSVQRQNGEHRRIGAVQLLNRKPLDLRRAFDSLLDLKSIAGGGSLRHQRLTDFPIRLGGADMIDLRVERQHSAAVLAVVTVPYVLFEIQIHLAPSISADRTIHIDEARPSPPDVQAEKGGYVHDVKGKVPRVDWNQLLPSWCCRQGKCRIAWNRYPAFLSAAASITSCAAALSTLSERLEWT